MIDISGFGLKIVVTALSSFPRGFTITEFAGDADPLDFPELTISESEVGLNGDLVVYKSANKVDVTVNVIPNSDADKDLTVLFSSNTVGRGRLSVNDIITLVGTYPDGSSVICANGVTTSYLPANGVASAGRLKSKPYKFTFETVQYIPA